MTPDEARSIVRTRDGSRCLRCGRSVVNFPSALHHRLSKSGGGPDTVPNLVRLCGRDNSNANTCHGFAHQRFKAARDEGFRISRWTTQRPEEIPVQTYFGLVLLTPDGGYVHLDGLGSEVVG
jgi:hypothetical protein